MTTTELEADLHELFDAQTRTLGLGAPPALDDPLLIEAIGHRSPRRPLAVAAALLLTIGGAAVWWALDTRGGSVPSDEPGGLIPTEAPLLRLDAPGWTITYFTDFDPAPVGEGSTTFIVAGRGILGPRVDVYLSDAGSMPITDEEPEPIGIGGLPARLLVDGDRAQVHWTEPGGHTLEAVAAGVGVEDLVAIAELIEVDDAGLPVATGPLPGGLLPLSGRDAALMRTFYEYQWVHDDGRGLDVNLYPGGRPVHDERIAASGPSTDDRTVRFQGAEAYVVSEENMIRLNQLRGFWVLEITGQSEPVTDPITGELSDGTNHFASIEEFLAVAEQLVVVDAVTWRASLPADVVLRDEIGPAAAQLAVFPMPDGQPAPTVADEGFAQRRHRISESIAAQTVCAWLARLGDAIDSDDADTAMGAASVIHDVATWDELASIPSTIVAGAEHLTVTGRIREIDSALTDLRNIDATDENVDLADLDIVEALDNAMSTSGIQLDCATP